MIILRGYIKLQVFIVTLEVCLVHPFYVRKKYSFIYYYFSFTARDPKKDLLLIVSLEKS